MWRLDRARTALFTMAGVSLVGLLLWLGLASAHRETDVIDKVEAADEREKDEPLREDKRDVSDSQRAELLARARLWREPSVPVQRASLVGTSLDSLRCKFKVDDLGGTTPKFDCTLEDGEEVRIKYGNGPEVPAEAAATRLLKALGFAADDITIVRTVRCYGCPKEPFSTMKAVEITRAESLYEHLVDYGNYEEFEWVALERKFNARPVQTGAVEGWTFFELDRVDESIGGAPRAHVDAIRLVAVLLAHWDNKSENQRLVCLSQRWPKDAACAEPFLVLQDVGATFGPSKLDLAAWTQVPMWEDRRTCTVSMGSLPFSGATFGRARVSEEGRRFIGGLLAQLSDQQLTDLFTSARFAEPRGLFTPTSSVADWVAAFKDKVRAINEGPPCPAVAGADPASPGPAGR